MPERSTAQGRLFVTDGPVASPGQCGMCGYSQNDRKFLDPRLDFEFYGSLSFCESCVGSMADIFGYLSPAQAQALEARVEEVERQLISLRAVANTLEDFRVAIASVDGRDRPFIDGPSSSDVADSSVTEPVTDDAGTVAGGAESGDQPDQSRFFKGRDDLRDATANASTDLSL